MSGLNLIQTITVGALPLLFAITVHEVAHGWMARRLGDPTAMLMGRLTLNPVKHIDPIGTVALPLLLLLSGTGVIFGWAKPVPVTWENLKHPQRDGALVAAAGPASNLLMAFFWALVVKLALALAPVLPWAAEPLALMGQFGITFNLVLMVLNLLPVPPLDGSKVLAAFLPGPLAYKISRVETAGLVVLMVLLASGLLGKIIWPPIQWLHQLLFTLFGL